MRESRSLHLDLLCMKFGFASNSGETTLGEGNVLLWYDGDCEDERMERRRCAFGGTEF
jgi:hypothetical protein